MEKHLATLLISQYNAQISFKSATAINAKFDSLVADSQPLAFTHLHYNYNVLRADAIGAGLLIASGDQLYDVVNRAQIPYYFIHCFD